MCASAPSLPNSTGHPSAGNAFGKKNPASLENPMRKCKSVGNVFFRFFFYRFREACNALWRWRWAWKLASDGQHQRRTESDSLEIDERVFEVFLGNNQIIESSKAFA